MWLSSLVILAVAGVATPPPMVHHTAIANAWFRALPAHLPAGGYFELRNTGQWPSTLSGADSPNCGMIMLHKSEQKNGMDTMSDVTGVDISPGPTMKLAPRGFSPMLPGPGPGT